MTLMRSESLFGLSLITLTFSDDTASFPGAHHRPAAGRRRRAAAGRDPRTRARGDAAGRGVPVPPHQRPARSLPAALRNAMERRARAAPGAGRRRHRALRRLSQGIARRSRRRAPVRARADAGRPRAGDRQVQRERRRRLPAPRRPGTDGARPRLPRIGRGHQAHRVEEQGRHAGDRRRRCQRGAVVHAAARHGRRRPGKGGHRELRLDAARPESLASCWTASTPRCAS